MVVLKYGEINTLSGLYEFDGLGLSIVDLGSTK